MSETELHPCQRCEADEARIRVMVTRMDNGELLEVAEFCWRCAAAVELDIGDEPDEDMSDGSL